MGDIERLVEQMEKNYGTIGPWEFYYEYPGVFVYHHRKKKELDIFFTPDWSDEDVIDIQVQREGDTLEGADIPFTNRTVENLFHAVLPWLEKWAKKPLGPREWSPRD